MADCSARCALQPVPPAYTGPVCILRRGALPHICSAYLYRTRLRVDPADYAMMLAEPSHNSKEVGESV